MAAAVQLLWTLGAARLIVSITSTGRNPHVLAQAPREAPGLAFAVSATTLAASAAAPDSTSAVSRHPQVQITLPAPHIELIRSRTSSSFPAAINWRSSCNC
jgi:hypothetical protein